MANESPWDSLRARASQFFFLLMLFSFPIFSVPCANGTCSSPAEVVAVYAHGNGILPQDLAKALLYPGALLHTVEEAVADGVSIQWPSWDSLLNNFFNTSKSNSQIQAPVSLGFVVGCVLCLVGGVLSMFGPSVFSFVGMMVTLYYIYTRGGEDDNIKSMPMFALAVFCSFGWISSDLFTQRGVLWQQPSARGITRKQL